MSDLAETYDGTTLTVADLALIGRAVLNLAATSRLMRHSSPAASTGYAEPSTVHEWLACDFASWCESASTGSQPALRLMQFLDQSGWQRQMTAEVAA